MDTPPDVCIVEVGPRDGLQNESSSTSVNFRVDLINRLTACGFKFVEVGSFVSPKWVPQMSNTSEVLRRIERVPETTHVVLVPNLKGMNDALDSRVDEIAIFTAASETFSHKNVNCSIEETFNRFEPITKLAAQNDITVRGYISCVVGCPYEGKISTDKVIPIVERLLQIGCREVSLGDTIGVGTAQQVKQLLVEIGKVCSISQIAVHFHDTYGQALANILESLDYGVNVIDSSVGGLGGCPYAKGASGNVATEEVVYLLDGLGVRTGIQLDELVDVTEFVSRNLGKPPQSRVANAMIAKRLG